jgi:sn-glycerol 3-phosphate transport system ATP-binding protein
MARVGLGSRRHRSLNAGVGLADFIILSRPLAIDMVEELGASKLLHGQLGGAECIAAVPSAIPLASLDRLFAQIAPESIHLFDRETGTRMC